MKSRKKHKRTPTQADRPEKQDDQYAAALDGILAAAKDGLYSVPDKKWSRDELYCRAKATR